MRFSRPHVAVLLSIVLTTPVLSHQAVSSDQAVAARDAMALSILRSSFTAASGPNLLMLMDASFQMTVISGTDDHSGDGIVTLKTMGSKLWRTEADTPNGPSAFIVNGSQGLSQSGKDQQSFLTVSVAEAGNWFLPAFSIVGEYADQGLKISYVGLEGTAHHIQILRTSTDPIMQEILSPCDVYIDSLTLLPTKLVFSLHPPMDLKVRIPAEVDYSDYRLTSGVLLPFDVKFSIQGNLVSEYKLNSFATNVGLSASDFSVK